jgi:ABC-2 type transport system permease protein
VNLFLRELRAYRKSTLTWIASLSVLVVVFMAMYPAFSQDVEALTQIFVQFPVAVRLAFGISMETFFTIYGFFGYLLGFAILAASIQAMNVGVGVISKEVSGKTADFLLSKPIGRASAVSAKLGAALTVIVITNVVFSAASYIGVAAVAKDSFSVETLLLMTSTMFLVQLVFLALGALLSVIIPKIKSVVSVSLPTVFAFYIIGSLGDVLGREEVRYISPFRYYDWIYIIEHNSLETKYLAVEAAVVAVSILACYVIFMKKDIRAAA